VLLAENLLILEMLCLKMKFSFCNVVVVKCEAA